MTIDRAIEILNPEHREHYDGMDEVNEACRMGMEALERMRWIPCSERMPEPGKRVLATDGGFVGEMYIGKRGEWRRYNVTYIQDLMALDILWWKPLPEPPKEDENGRT